MSLDINGVEIHKGDTIRCVLNDDFLKWNCSESILNCNLIVDRVCNAGDVHATSEEHGSWYIPTSSLYVIGEYVDIDDICVGNVLGV